MRTANPQNADDVLAEKTLWQIYRSSLRIPDSKFNWMAAILAAVIASGFAVTEANSASVLKAVQELATLGFNSAISLLGFLIAGFTIFAASAKPFLVALMLKKRHKETGLIYLKYNYFTIVRVFVYFLAFAIFQLSILAFGQIGGVFHAWAKILGLDNSLLSVLVRCSYVISVAFWAFMMMQLKSFVFNVYHFAMTMIKSDQVEASLPRDAA